MEIKLEHK